MNVLAGLATAAAVLAVLTVVRGTASPRRSRRAPLADLDAWLVQAGAGLSARQFLAGSLALTVVTALVVAGLTRTPVVGLVPGLLAGIAPRLLFARRRTERMRELVAAWPDALREVIGSVTAGRSLPQALAGLAHNGPPPLRTAFAHFEVRARLVGVEHALRQVKAELADPTSDRVVEVLAVAHAEGGRAVLQVLHDLADSTTADVRAAEQIATESLEQRINARAVFVLPWLTLLLLTARSGPFREFYQSPAGFTVVAIGLVASLVGVVLVSRLSREPEEPRVLTGGAS